MPRTNTKSVSTNLTPENYEKLREWCVENEREIAETIRAALEDYTGLDLSQAGRGEYERAESEN